MGNCPHICSDGGICGAGIYAHFKLRRKWSGFYGFRFFGSGSRLVADASVCDEKANIDIFADLQQVLPLGVQ